MDLATTSLDSREQLSGRLVPDGPLEPQHSTERPITTLADPVRTARRGVRLSARRRRSTRHGSASPSKVGDRRLDPLSGLLLGVERVPLQGHEPVDRGVADLLLQLEKRMVDGGARIDTDR
jgi:hypothetical protein